MHKSIATIDAPEFINLQPLDINPLMSKCEIKVLYLGKNRNGSFIDKDIANEMAKTLRGAPIVGYYKKEQEDFVDHGNRVILDDEGLKFECLTTPYGFVAPDAKVWYQNFEDTDDFGNIETRTYLMTIGYLWTGQFEECQVAINEGRPQSMELDEKSLNGHWATDKKDGMDFFIINDAIFSKLCILGENVEPCFEGASITTPQVSSNFTQIDENFKNTLFTMMQELKFALQGGQQMEDVVEVIETVETEPVVEAEPVVEQTEEVSEEVIPTAPIEEPKTEDNFTAGEEENNTVVLNENSEVQEEPSVDLDQTDYQKKEDDDEDDKDDKSDESDEDNSGKSSDDDKTDDQDDEDDKKKYQLLSEQYNQLQEKYSSLETEYQKLIAFKAEVEDKEKDAMIKQFCFLSDEDKKDVIDNKSKYTVEEIESKLSVISVRKKVNFDLDDNSKNDINIEDPIKTYSFNEDYSNTPAWVKALQNNKNNK